MNLRDIVDESTDLNGLQVLLEQDFEIDSGDIKLIGTIGKIHRSNSNHPDKEYDNSSESRIFLTFYLNVLRTDGVDEDTIARVHEFLQIMEETYQIYPIRSSAVIPGTYRGYWELVKESGHKIKNSRGFYDARVIGISTLPQFYKTFEKPPNSEEERTTRNHIYEALSVFIKYVI